MNKILAFIFCFLLASVHSALTDIQISSFSATQGVTIKTPANSVSCAGDFNGDGIDDVVIGVQSSNICYVIYGSKTGLIDIDATILSALSAKGLGFQIKSDSKGAFGTSVASVDFDGDGISDIVIGAYTDSGNKGGAYIIYGSKTPFTDIDVATTSLSAVKMGFKITGTTSSYLGWSVSGAGDLNKDGRNDLVIGAYNGENDAKEANAGAAYVLYNMGSKYFTDIDFSTGVTLKTINMGFRVQGKLEEYVGRAVSNVGDFNGDGIDDLAIGCAGQLATTGAVYIIYGSLSRLADMDTSKLTKSQGFNLILTANTQPGFSVSGIGDINGDGLKDIAFGTRTGYIFFVVYGRKKVVSDINLDTVSLSAAGQGFKITGSSGSNFGISVRSAGDINADGLSDMIIGASGSSKAYIIYGNKSGFSDIDLAATPNLSTNNQGITITGIPSSSFGKGVSNAGDFNGDGGPDIIIGASSASLGYTYIIYGIVPPPSTTPPNTGGGTSPEEPSTEDPPTEEPPAEEPPAEEPPTEEPPTEEPPAENPPTEEPPAEPSTGGLPTGGVGGPSTSPPVEIPNGSVSGGSGTGIPAVVKGSGKDGILPSEFMKGITEVVGVTGEINFYIATVLRVVSFTNPAALVIVAMSDSLMYFKYLKIDYPPRLQYMLDHCVPGSSRLNKALAAPESVKSHIIQYPLTEKFRSSEFHSSFLVNFWPSLMILAGIGTLVMIGNIAKRFFKVSKNEGKVRKFVEFLFTKVGQAVQWNLMLSMLIGYYGNISLFTAFEMKTSHFSTSLEWVSFFFCISITLTALAVQTAMVTMIYKMQKAKSQVASKRGLSGPQAEKSKSNGCEIMSEHFMDGSLLQRNFLTIFSVKIYVFYAILSYWLSSPLAQTIVNSVLGFAMVAYMVIARPLKSKVDLIHYISLEVIFEVINICTLGLSIIQAHDSPSYDAYVVLGDIIIFCNSIFTTVCTVFLVLQVSVILREVYKWIKQRSSAKIGIQNKTFSVQEKEVENSDMSSLPSTERQLNVTGNKSQLNYTYSQSFETNSVSINTNLDEFFGDKKNRNDLEGRHFFPQKLYGKVPVETKRSVSRFINGSEMNIDQSTNSQISVEQNKSSAMLSKVVSNMRTDQYSMKESPTKRRAGNL